MFLLVPGTLCTVIEPADRERLAFLVRERRLGLQLTKDEAAAIAKVSPVTWTKVETGQKVRDLVLYAVDRALGWQVGSSERVVAFGQLPEVIPVGVGGDSRSFAGAGLVGGGVQPDPRPVGDVDLSGLDPADIERVRAYVQGLKDGKHQ